MVNQSSQIRPNENRDYDEKNVSIFEYILIVEKWKWRMFFGTLLCIMIAGFLIYRMPLIYEISMVIEPGYVGMNESWDPVFMNRSNMIGKIENGAYDSRIHEKLKADPEKIGFRFKVETIKDSKLLKISTEWKKSNITTGKIVLRSLAGELARDDGNIVRLRKEELDREIQLKHSDIQENQNQIKLRKANLINLKERRDELVKELKEVKENTEKLKHLKSRVVESESRDENISLILFFTNVQQNVTYFNQLNDQLNELKINIDSKVSQIISLEKLIKDIRIEIEGLETKKKLIKASKVIANPEVSDAPVKPKRKQLVFLSGVVALMLSFLIAIFVETYQKSKLENISKEQTLKRL